MFDVKHDENPPQRNAPGTGQAWRTKYPFRSMRVGDYFDAKDDPINAKFAAHKFAARNDMKFVTRKQEDGSMRVWRIE